MESTIKKILYVIIGIICGSNIYAQIDSVDLFLKDEMIKRNIPGLQLAIVRNGNIVKLGNYGWANIQDSIRVTENTVFTINSMTKAFTGVALMQLVEQGKLDLSKPVSNYLDSLPVTWKNITIKQIISHNSGIPNIMDDNANMISTEGDKASWKKVQTLPLEFQPGEKFSYNQTNYILLGLIIDKLSGLPFSKFITRDQLQKVRMSNTINAGFSDSYDVIYQSARGYTKFRTGNLTNIFEVFPPFLRTATGMSSTAKEIAHWLIALQDRQLLKNETSLSVLWTPAILNNGETGGFGNLLNGYALGWPTVSRPEHSAVASVGGGRSGLFVYPEDDLAVIILTNLQGASPESFIDEVAGFYIPEMKESNGFGLSPSVKLLKGELDKSGYANSIDQATTFKRKNKTFELTENEINSWGYKLLEQKRKSDAIEILKLNVHLNPNSSNTYDSLGEAYIANGDATLAIENYEHSLKLNPDNSNAIEQIKKIKSGK